MLGSSAPTVGLLQYKEMQLRGQAQLLTMCTSQGSSRTLGPLGIFDSTDLLDLGPFGGVPRFFTSRTFWQF